MTEPTLYIAIFAAWASGIGFAGLLDAIYGFTEWDSKGVALTTFMWVSLGILSILWVAHS